MVATARTPDTPDQHPDCTSTIWAHSHLKSSHSTKAMNDALASRLTADSAGSSRRRIPALAAAAAATLPGLLPLALARRRLQGRQGDMRLSPPVPALLETLTPLAHSPPAG